MLSEGYPPKGSGVSQGGKLIWSFKEEITVFKDLQSIEKTMKFLSLFLCSEHISTTFYKEIPQNERNLSYEYSCKDAK